MKILNKVKKLLALLLIIVMQLVFIPVPKAHAYSNPAVVPLLTVANFAALAKTLISSPTGPTVLNNGDLGIDSPGTCTGFESPCTGADVGTINSGSIQYQNAVALQGQTDATAAVTNIGGRVADQTLAANLTGLTLTQGVYEVPAAATNLTGDLTLNGDANSVFIFHLTSTLITNTGSRVLLTGGAQACNVFWKVDSSATFEGTTTMVGTVLASASISFTGGGATLAGRAIAQTAAITFNNTTVNNSSCAAASTSSSSSSSSGGSSSAFCPAFTPTNSPNLFQIDRAGSTAVLHFTPVNDYLTYYYIAYGLSPGSEQFGVTFPASLTSGVVSFTINDLDPNATYYFKVRGGNGCAPGGWSNNLTSDSKNPMLPSTGIGPRDRSTSWLLLTVVLLSAGLAHLPRKRERLPFKQG